MIYTVTVIQGTNRVRFGFNNFRDMSDFLNTALETVDGFEEGETIVTIAREEESPSDGNQ